MFVSVLFVLNILIVCNFANLRWCATGLLYDDYAWTDKNILPVQEALKRVDPEIREMRQRRIDRANDMAHKHIGIPEHMYNHQGHPFDPNLMYLTYVIDDTLTF